MEKIVDKKPNITISLELTSSYSKSKYGKLVNNPVLILQNEASY
jgi:hypothetical protein